MAGLELIQVLYVSRHGIRSPYPPNYGTLDDFSAYTQKIFPSNEEWGMTYQDFTHQRLTPHGKKVLPYFGSYFAARFVNDGLDFGVCQNIVCYADDSSRDIDSAKLWLEGFGCPNVPVNIVNTTHHAELRPVLYDLFDSGCPIATEEQVLGTFGGSVDALTKSYSSSIDLIMDILEMPTDASICSLSNSNFDSSTQDCTLFETGYRWTGYVYDGGFKCPTYYARYFAEYFTLQYLSNVTDWAFGLLTPEQLVDLNELHVKTHDLGTNHWNSLSYGSEQLGYLVATMDQMVTGKSHPGCSQDPGTKLLLLFSHDANILYLRQLMGLSWIPNGYTEGVADPGGALSFDLWKDQNSYYVKIHYDIATPLQQRNGEILTLENPPSVSELIIPECGSLYCPWEQFKSLVLSKINLDCIQEPLRSTLIQLSSSNPSNAHDDDDGNTLFASPLEILIITVLSVCSSLIAVGFILYLKGYRVTLHSSTDSEQNRLIEVGSQSQKSVSEV